jgi:hypothetical protein
MTGKTSKSGTGACWASLPSTLSEGASRLGRSVQSPHLVMSDDPMSQFPGCREGGAFEVEVAWRQGG